MTPLPSQQIGLAASTAQHAEWSEQRVDVVKYNNVLVYITEKFRSFVLHK
jgi:chemotaxis methyl-accepting protein methylase